MKKILVILFATCLPMISIAQVRYLPLELSHSHSSSDGETASLRASIAPLFDNETVKLLDVIKTTKAQHHVDGLLIKYAVVEPQAFAKALSEKSDDEEDRHYYYGYSYDHETEYEGKYGIAFYLKESNQYVLQFSNDDFLLGSLGGRSAYNALVSEGGEAIIDITWGNNLAGPTYSKFHFSYNALKKTWRLSQFVDLKSDTRPPFYQYRECAFNEGIPMKAFTMEAFLKKMPAIDQHTLCLTYSSGDDTVLENGDGDDGFTDFYQQIEKVKKQGKGLLLKRLLKDPYIAQVISGQGYYSGEDRLHIGSDVVEMNNLAYLLEQMDSLYFAQIILESIVLDVPERTVAYINLGDVYRKQGDVSKAKQAYTTYCSLMKKEGKKARIPNRVKTYIESR